jgi:hypothetical protein
LLKTSSVVHRLPEATNLTSSPPPECRHETLSEINDQLNSRLRHHLAKRTFNVRHHVRTARNCHQLAASRIVCIRSGGPTRLSSSLCCVHDIPHSSMSFLISASVPKPQRRPRAGLPHYPDKITALAQNPLALALSLHPSAPASPPPTPPPDQSPAGSQSHYANAYNAPAPPG